MGRNEKHAGSDVANMVRFKDDVEVSALNCLRWNYDGTSVIRNQASKLGVKMLQIKAIRTQQCFYSDEEI